MNEYPQCKHGRQATKFIVLMTSRTATARRFLEYVEYLQYVRGSQVLLEE